MLLLLLFVFFCIEIPFRLAKPHLMTKWLGITWKKYIENNQATITKAFKRCGMYNDANGKENHLVKI